MDTFKRAAAGLATVFVALGFSLEGPQLSAQAEEPAASEFIVTAAVGADGGIDIAETVKFDAGVPSQVVQRISLAEDAPDYTVYRYSISAVEISGNGAITSSYAEDGDYLVITVKLDSATTEITIGYHVNGAAFDEGISGDGTALTTIKWSLLQGLSIPVAKATGVVATPIAAQFTSVSCYSGSVAAPTKCSWAAGGTFDNPYPAFGDDARVAGEVITIQFSAPTSQIAVNEQIEELWTLGRAFSTQPLYLITALAALVVGGLLVFALQRANGRDVASVKDPTLVASFVPTGEGTVEFQVQKGFRPGQVGTIGDERVDPVDITATILDLAVRGHLRITELPAATAHAPLDWTFERTEGRDDLLPYELTLVDAIAPHSGDRALVSAIGASVAPVIGKVQSQLYDDVVANGWFTTRPDTTRNRWAALGWAAFVLSVGALVALVIFTKFGLLGLVLVAIAGLILGVSQTMPRRTAAGSAVLAGLNALSHVIATQPLDTIAKDKAYEEISEVLPYAIVLGSCARWTQALVDADNDPGVPDPEDLSWYYAPGTWSLSDLPAAFDSLVATLQGRLYGHG
ncbi:MAG: DUF2207 domain-containing protein [Propionibacteriaceae bacterium]|jgi:hypothetical protein|nr:DUF2207 domain-containing protein [Propionibacteriaceae bacterium]